MIKTDVLVIGGGITGASILRELSKYQLSSVLLEANNDIGSGITKGNGGVVHSGYDAHHGSLKAVLNVKGALMYPELAKQLEFAYQPKPTLTVAFNEEDRKTIEELLTNGLKNNVPGLRIIEKDELFSMEPNINPEAICALYAPSAGITDPYEVAIACVENAIENGSQVFVDAKVTAIYKGKNGYRVISKQGEFLSRSIINAAGVFGDEVAKLVNDHNYKITQRHGALLIIEKAVGIQLNASLFPVPRKDTKGMATIPACAGNIIVGSTAIMQDDKEYKKFSKEEVNDLFNSAQKMVPNLKREHIIRVFNGLRPVEVHSNNDFVIEESNIAEGFYNCIGIQSPGVAAAPAVAMYVVDLLKQKQTLTLKETFNTYRKRIIDFSEASNKEKQQLIEKDANYGNILCRCEVVSEAEILDAIHRPCGARTLDGVKRRTRAGMGRCQGGFCQPKIMDILARELGIPYEKILLEEENSSVLIDQEVE